MRSRELPILIGLAVLLAAGAVMMLGRDVEAFGEPALLPDRIEPAAAIATGPGQVGVVEAMLPNGSDAPELVTYDPRRTNEQEWTSGIIRGDIPLTASVLGQIQTIAVVVDELKSIHAGGSRPWHRVVPVELRPNGATPTFEIQGVPFSDYGYTVRVHSPGLNGGQSTVSVTQDSPTADGIQLPITPGAPYALRFQDQDFQPITHTDVRLQPLGEPLGRPAQFGQTDNYGSVAFDTVLAGEYEVFIGQAGAPLVDPPLRVVVQPGAAIALTNSVQAQGRVITVPRGSPLTVRVSSYGYPVQGVRVRAQNTDRRQLMQVTGETDARGECHFANLLDGTWQIDVNKTDYQHSTRQKTISREKPSEGPVEIELRRLR
jgi:hypothetical protein